METQQKVRPHFLAKAIAFAEAFAIAMIGVAAILALTGNPSDELLMLSMSTLSLAFMVYSRVAVKAPFQEEETLGFLDLMVFQIVPKVMWMSAALATVGILFSFLSMPGYQQLLTIGTATLGISLAIAGLFSISSRKDLSALYPVLLRAVPVFSIALYFLWKADVL
jgi:hypothetical protein